jgi:hypothetical protein
MVAVFVSQSAALLKLRGEIVQQTFVTANWLSTREIFAVARSNNLLFITSCILGSILKMEVVCTNETLLPTYQTTLCHNLGTLIFFLDKIFCAVFLVLFWTGLITLSQ